MWRSSADPLLDPQPLRLEPFGNATNQASVFRYTNAYMYVYSVLFEVHSACNKNLKTFTNTVRWDTKNRDDTAKQS